MFALLLIVTLFAADFWQSKPFTDWTDKDVHKMITSSPWAREVSVSFGSGMPAGGRGRRGGGGGSGMGDVGTPGGAVGGGGGEMGRGGGGGGRSGDDMAAGGAPSMTVTLSWESSLPVRQARMRLKYGAEAGTSPQAKSFLGQEATVYVIAVVSPMIRPFENKGAVIEQTLLSVKGKEPIKASNLEPGRGSALFFFPKTTPLSLDDKEVEFSTKVGPLIIKQKFRLKDMVLKGKLEL